MPHGPLYCETGHPWLFMAEPVNTITNAFIVLAAVLAFLQVRRAKVGWPVDLCILLFLLFATGVGSFAWHAFRTGPALLLDAAPGLLFLFFFTGFWVARLFGAWTGFVGVVGLIAATVGAMMLSALFFPGVRALPPPLALAPAFATIAIIGFALVAATARKVGWASARIAAAALVFAVFAALFRSVDLTMCRVIPFGTHFLWHILLSTAAYLAIVFLLRVREGVST